MRSDCMGIEGAAMAEHPSRTKAAKYTALGHNTRPVRAASQERRSEAKG